MQHAHELSAVEQRAGIAIGSDAVGLLGREAPARQQRRLRKAGRVAVQAALLLLEQALQRAALLCEVHPLLIVLHP